MVKKGDEEKKISRREFLKYVRRAAGSGAVYGVGGNIAGRIYRGGRDALGNIKTDITNMGEYIEKNAGGAYDFVEKNATGAYDFVEGKVPPKIKEGAKKIYDTLEETASKIVDNLKGEEAEKPKPKQKKEVSRRDFFSSFLNYFHEHPVFTGTTSAFLYGAGKSGVRNYADYKTQLSRKQTELANTKTHEKIEELTGEIRDLKRLILNLR